jgi:hypothetical protein
MKGFTALAIIAGVMLAYFAGCVSDSPEPATSPATSPTVCAVPFTDGERMEALSYAVKHFPPGYDHVRYAYWTLSYSPGPQPYYLAWYQCAQAMPWPTLQIYEFGPTFEAALDAVIARLWFDPAEGQAGDKLRMDWLRECVLHSYYNDDQLKWEHDRPDVFTNAFATYDGETDPPGIVPWEMRGESPRQAIDKSIAATTWDQSRGVPTCGVGVLIIAPLTDPDDEDAAR